MFGHDQHWPSDARFNEKMLNNLTYKFNFNNNLMNNINLCQRSVIENDGHCTI